MNKSIFAAALLFAATPVVLTSCSKSPVDQEIALMNELSDIMENTTAENASAMLERLATLEGRATELAAALKAVNKEDVPPETQAEGMKAFARFMNAGQKLDTVDSDAAREVAKKVGSIMNKLN